VRVLFVVHLDGVAVKRGTEWTCIVMVESNALFDEPFQVTSNGFKNFMTLLMLAGSTVAIHCERSEHYYASTFG